MFSSAASPGSCVPLPFQSANTVPTTDPVPLCRDMLPRTEVIVFPPDGKFLDTRRVERSIHGSAPGSTDLEKRSA